jgi:hypothetical protein
MNPRKQYLDGGQDQTRICKADHALPTGDVVGPGRPQSIADLDKQFAVLQSWLFNPFAGELSGVKWIFERARSICRGGLSVEWHPV